MKKFFFRSLYLILPLILVMLYMEVNLAKIPNSYSYKRLCLEKQLDSIEVLILGSSQALYGLNPDGFSYKTYNLSDISQDLYYDHQLVMKYLDKMPSLRYAIISISYFSFGYSVTDGAEAWRIYYYSQFWDIKHPEADVMELKRISKFFLYTPNTSLLLLLNGFKANYTDHLGSNGYFSAAARKDTTGQISDSSGRKRVELHNSLIRENRIAQNRDQLEMLVAALKKRGVVPIIITPPVLPTYSGYTDPQRMKRNSEIIASICNRYQCVYHNFFTDNRFTQADFTDNDHLNSVGAGKFSKIINDLIIPVQ